MISTGDDYALRDDFSWTPGSPFFCNTIPDLYVQVQVGPIKQRTQRARSSLSPNWDQILVFSNVPHKSVDVSITIKHSKSLAHIIPRDPKLASAKISLSDLLEKCDGREAVTLSLEPSGEVEVYLQKLHRPVRKQERSTISSSIGDTTKTERTVIGTISEKEATYNEKVKNGKNTSFDMEKLVALNRLDISGRFIISDDDPVTKGGNGIVYKGRCFIEGREVTIAAKEMRQDLRDQRMRKAFEKEVYVWAKLHHANVLPLLGYAFSRNHTPLMISEWMENGSVRDYMDKNPGCDILNLIQGISNGLAYLHSGGIIHSDVKPDNVLVNEKGEAIITDFGCSRIFESTCTIGLPTHTLRGTYNYMAPEIFNSSGDLEYTKEMDVWAFGMTVYELLTHIPPYRRLNPGQIAKAVGELQLPSIPISFRNKTTPDQDTRLLLWTVCQLCWKKEPNERPHMNTLVDLLAKRSSAQLPIYDIDPNILFSESICEGQDWFAISNPYARRRWNISHMYAMKYAGPIGSTQFSNDGKLLAVGCDEAAHFYDVETAEHCFTLTVDCVFLDALRFHPDGKSVVTAGKVTVGTNPTTNNICFWDLATRQVTRTFEGSVEDEFENPFFTKDGSRFVTGSFKKAYILIWDVQSKTSTKLETDLESILSASFFNDDRFIVAGSESNIVIWNASTMEMVKNIEAHEDNIWPIKCMPDGRSFISGCVDGTVKVWSIETTTKADESSKLELSSTISSLSSYSLPGHKDTVSCLAVSADGNYVASGGIEERNVMYYDLRTREALFMIKTTGDELFRLSMSPLGDRLVTGYEDGIVRIWRISEL